MKPNDPNHSKALEEKIKKLVDSLVEKIRSQGDVVTQDTQSNISILLMRLALEQETAAYELAITHLMRQTCERVAKVKCQLNIVLVLDMQTLPAKVVVTPVVTVKPVKPTPALAPAPAPAPAEKRPSRVAQFFLNLRAKPVEVPVVENTPEEMVEEADIFTLPKDYGWVELLVDAVIDSIIRDYNQARDLGFSRLLTLRNDLEEGARHLDRTSEVFAQVITWVQGLNQVILHAQPHSFADHCHQFEYRQYMLKKHGLLTQAGNPLSDSMKHALLYYVDNSSLLEDFMDINECRLLVVPDKSIFIDNSLILADSYRILRDMIDGERKADAVALVSKTQQKPYHRKPELQLIVNRINQITRTFIEQVDKQGFDLYARRYVRDAIKGCYLAKIKIYNFEARKSKLDSALIHRNICALADLTEYIMERLKHGEYHTWAGQFFDWLCAYVNWPSACTRDAKLFSAGLMFNAVADWSQHKHNTCAALDKKYAKTMNDGQLGDIKKQYQIKL